MEDNKYYTPDIEDFFVGYEYEFCPWDWKNKCFLDIWKKGKYVREKSLHKVEEKYIRTGNVRTKYLDEEDILSEGWIYTGIGLDEGDKMFSLENNKQWNLFTHNGKEGKMSILISKKSPFLGTVYNGECKSINEFRKLMKWLNVKK